MAVVSGFGNGDGRHRTRPEAGDRVGKEWRAETIGLGQQTAGEGAYTRREDENALVDGDHAASSSRRGDVGEDDLPGGDDQARTGAGDEAGQDEFRVGRRHGAPQIAGGGHHASQCQRR
ncbi:MAG: hypothetical protein NTZ05_01865, partial [Chloroflexi bacterium]|nr:hypothetical protein [Chloroflexota bacterium]